MITGLKFETGDVALVNLHLLTFYERVHYTLAG